MRPMFAAAASDVVGNVRTYPAGEFPLGMLDGDGATASGVSDLEDWRIERGADGEVMVMAPGCDPGALTLSPKERSLASRLLYKLACDLLEREDQRQAA